MQEVKQLVLQPALDKLFTLTDIRVWEDEVTVVSDHRWKTDHEWKWSLHMIIPQFCIKAKHMVSFYESLQLPDWVDTGIWTAGSMLWRIVGSCKDSNSKHFSKPAYFAEANDCRRPFHEYLLTFLTGNEVDVTSQCPLPGRPSSRARSDPKTAVPYLTTVRTRSYCRAPYLSKFTDGQLDRLACAQMEHLGIDCDFGRSPVMGNRIYYTCGPNGRKCRDGRHHDRNRAYVEFGRSGDMHHHCYATACKDEGPTFLGYWVSDLLNLLDSDVWGPTQKVDADLLHNLKELAIESTTLGKTRDSKLRQMPDMPWYKRLEDTVSRYLSHYFVFIIREGLYIMQTLTEDGSYDSYQAFPRAKVKDTVRSYAWSFDIFEHSAYKQKYATLARFCGEPFDADVEADEYNLSKNAMPLLQINPTKPSEEDVKTIQPLLDHILSSLCAGNEDDNNVFMGWIAHVAKFPNKKIGW